MKPIANLRCLISILMSLVLSQAPLSYAASSWHALKDIKLEVKRGSALDFSGFSSRSLAGHLRFEREDRTQRFLCASMVPSAPNGGIPEKSESDRWVEQLKRTGYNLVRLHYIDAVLMTGRSGDFDYDPAAFDRLHYLMAKLKDAGIYWFVDGLTSSNGAYGNVQPHRWVNRHSLHEKLYYDPSALAHWKRVVTSIWGKVNPYTGLAPLNDPAMLGMVLVNEGGIAFISTLSGHYAAGLREPFGAWLAGRYPDDAALKNAWGGKTTRRDHVGVSVDVPDKIRGKDARSRDFAIFVAERETALYRDMEAHVRLRGFKGLVTNYNNWNLNHAHSVRNSLDWVDMHAYQSLPTGFSEPGSSMPQTSIFDDVGRYGRVLANSRHWGKPFTVTEYGQPFWNQWRHESAAWLPALAAFQGWDAICQFAELPVMLEYNASAGPSRRRALVPFGVGADPIARGGERLAALLFLRGDLAPSRAKVRLSMDPTGIFEDGKAWGQVPEDLSRLALVAASGLDMSATESKVKADGEMAFLLDSHSSGLLDKRENAALKKGFLPGKDPILRLKASGLLPASNRSDPAKGLFETDTGQMLFDARNKRLIIATDRTVAFTLRSGSENAGGIELTGLSSPATVAVGALDDQVIEKSKRMLVWVLTDAINTEMEFSDNSRMTLKKLGKFPPRIRAVNGRLAIRHATPGSLKVWAVDQAGRRVAQVSSNAEGGSLKFSVDNVVPGYGPVTYFEVAEK